MTLFFFSGCVLCDENAVITWACKISRQETRIKTESERDERKERYFIIKVLLAIYKGKKSFFSFFSFTFACRLNFRTRFFTPT